MVRLPIRRENTWLGKPPPDGTDREQTSIAGIRMSSMLTLAPV